MQMPSLFVLLGWSALIVKYPVVYSPSSFSGNVESKYFSDKQMMSILFFLIGASIKDTLTKLPLRI